MVRLKKKIQDCTILSSSNSNLRVAAEDSARLRCNKGKAQSFKPLMS